MMTNFEVGYTPTNLRLVIEKLGVTQAALARLLGVAERTLRQWLNEDLESRNHADMPLKQWRKVLALLATANVV
jgi:DNA-binding transcriptional regulator YiaG